MPAFNRIRQSTVEDRVSLRGCRLAFDRFAVRGPATHNGTDVKDHRVTPDVPRYDYYTEKLAAERLERCYELAPPRVRQYLSAEIEHLASLIPRGGVVLELGCGYGRVLERVAAISSLACGIDTSLDSLRLGRHRLEPASSVVIAAMDATGPAFRAGTFDVVFCVQNGISSFHVDQRSLVTLAVRIAKPGGRVVFSSYADEFWEHRLEWFRIQSAHGLIGEIDETATGDGTIVCRDGFSATNVTPDRFSALARGLGDPVEIEVIDGSSVFCDITVASG
jgi:2-polyprenyl-6-hydroxyphenyl methylase/3-demethylubiquinone-9 3-methyltransferase